MSAKQTKKNSGKRVAMTVLCIVLGVILISMLAGTILVNHLYGKMNYVDPETEVTIDDVQVIYSASEMAKDLELIDYRIDFYFLWGCCAKKFYKIWNCINTIYIL